MSLKVFGQRPRGTSMTRITSSPHYKDGRFHNLTPTVMMKDGFSLKTFWDFFTAKHTRPPKPVPAIKHGLNSPAARKTELTWFGHSSYLVQSHGLNILVDPVFSSHASPVPIAGKSFDGASVYSVADMPDTIDLLIVTHDHYDHMDYPTLRGLAPRVKLVCTPLGVGAHLQHWGFEAKRILEFDWWETQPAGELVTMTAVPARHFSGRGVRNNRTLWAAFVLQLPDVRIFIGGDSGYGDHFRQIGERYGPFDLALLECGQYNERWPYIHMMPEETVQAAIDLKAEVLMPVHWGKFALALHTWDEPVVRVTASAAEKGMRITTPRIGEAVVIGSHYPQDAWWSMAK